MPRAFAILLLLAHAATADSASLDARTYWRSHATFRAEAYGETAAGAKGSEAQPHTALPPAEWPQADFDDSGWWRAPGPFQAGYGFCWNGATRKLALLCLRGKFAVTDPSRVRGLSFSAVYRGGIVVYVNGKEIARQHLAEGTIGLETLADAYPFEAYTQPGGKLGIRWGWREPEEFKGRLELRLRRLSDVRIPPESLRKGVNVLAIELHRAPTHPQADKIKNAHNSRWSTLGLLEATLKAGASPNASRPKGAQVWNACPLTAVFAPDYGDPNEPLRPIRLVGVRKGAFSGQVVVGSDAPLKGLQAQMSALERGDAAIPPEAVQVRFALPDGSERGVQQRYPGIRDVKRFDALRQTPPAEVPVLHGGAVQPVWITVNVPADANAGIYAGELAIRRSGKELARVPVELKVCDWALPDPKEFVSHVGLIQSVESVALRYGVPMWSERHLQLIERSLELMAQVGSDVVIVPLMARHHFGKEGLVRWVRKGDGAFFYDYRVFDRYMDLVQKHLKLEVVCLYLWDHNHAAGAYFGKKTRRKAPVPVSVLDPVTDEVGEMDGPIHGTPESEAFWKPVLDELRARLHRRGVADEAIMVGMASDVRPTKAETAALQKIAPYARWVLHSHGFATQLNGVPVGYIAHVWGTRGVPDPAAARQYGWQRRPIVTVFPRYGSSPTTLFAHSPLGTYAMVVEAMLMANYRGVGRIGADFWPVLKGPRGRMRTIISAYSSWAQMSLTHAVPSVLAPGPDGAIATVRFELLRQGVQEAEARVFIEKALADKQRRARLGDDLATRCQALLDERARVFNAYRHAWAWYPASGAQARSEKLFAAAAAVAKAHAR